MTKIPFNVKFKSQIESGEYKVELRDGRTVKIIYWEAKGPAPIIGLFMADDGYETATQAHPNGRWSDDESYESDYDLFLITPEQELTEFEKTLGFAMGFSLNDMEKSGDTIINIKEAASELLALARKELQPEIDAEIEKAYKNADEVMYRKGKEDALKDLPRWRTIEEATTKRTDEDDCVTTETMLVKGWINRVDYRIVQPDCMVNRKMLCIPVRDLAKLPGFKED